MNDDGELAELVRSALEEGIRADASRLQVIRAFAERTARLRRWRRLGWLSASLVAASLAVMLAVRTLVSPADERSGVKDAIGLLCELEGIETNELLVASADELLMAWQEIPCIDSL